MGRQLARSQCRSFCLNNKEKGHIYNTMKALKNSDHFITLEVLSDFAGEKFNIDQLNIGNNKKQSTKLRQISFAQDPIYLTQLMLSGQKVDVAIKVFKKTFKIKQWVDNKFRGGIRAHRVWHASHYCYIKNIPTPKPVALLFNQHDNSYYYISYFHDSSNFRDELRHIFWRRPDNTHLINLLRYVANQIRLMHEAGLYHGDLGNQNILLSLNKKQWHNLAFVDLDRTKQYKQLSLKQRAKDFSRLVLPSDYLRIFKYMYFQDTEIPSEFNHYIRKYRKRYQRFKKYYYLRHPFKYLRNRKINLGDMPIYPRDNDIWIWDDNTSQAMVVLEKKDRNRYRHYGHFLKIISQMIISGRGLFKEYKSLLKLSYNSQVDLTNRLGIALNPDINYIEPELKLIGELNCRSVMLRFCHHEHPNKWATTISLIDRLNKQGIKISIALLQSRKAITQPSSWHDFVNTVVPAIIDKIEWIEVGHAINRVKWGIWHIREYISLYKPLLEFKKKHPSLKLIGPAVIDFEWPRLMNALKSMPKQLALYAASVHLYVDRRGAPENLQDGFSLLEKCALNKAVCNMSNRSENRFIISEVNWPLKNTGVYSPVNASYIPPKCLHENKGVSEIDYANYMIRYIAITLCSGFVDSLYWWRLSAHGYGLVDNRDNWRRRPAFFALKTFIELLGSSVFCEKLPSEKGDYLLLFKKDNIKIILAWTINTKREIRPSFIYKRQITLYGLRQDKKEINIITLSEQPIYYILN